HVERLRRNSCGGFLGLNQDIADLRAVAVDDDQVISAHGELRQPTGGLFCTRDLLLVRAAILGSQEGIPAEGHHRQLSVLRRHRAPAAWSCNAGRPARATARDPGSGWRTFFSSTFPARY